MRTNTSIRRAAALTAAAGLAACVSTARGTIINWNNAAGGAASIAANWNPAQVPTAADALVYNLNNTYTVTFSSGVALSTQHTYKRGTVTLSMSSPHTLSGNFRVGDVSGDAATTIFTTGDVTAGSVTVGNAAGSTGTLRVIDNDARLFTSGAGDVVVGAAGTGTLTITGGGVVQAADDVILGSSGGDGTASVSGFGITPIRFSSLSSSGVDGDIIVGNSSGTASTLTVTDSGIVSAADDLLVAPVSGASGSVNVGGNGNAATLNVGGNLQVGNNSSSTSAGSGQVSALNGGTIDVTGTIRLGDTTVGSGTLTCREGGQIICQSIICDPDGGFLNLIGGETVVSGGTLATPGSTLTLNGVVGETPVLHLVQGASASLSSSASPFRALTIGDSRSGLLTVDTGASLAVTAGDAVLGRAAGSSGYLRFGSTSHGAFASTSRLMIGDSGTGTVEVTGGSVSTGEIDIGAGAGHGTLTLSGSTSVLDASQPIYVGGTPAGRSGTGELRVESGAVLNANAAAGQTPSITVWKNTGTLVIESGGTINAADTIYVEGGMTLNGGVINSARVLYFGNDPNTYVYNFNGVINTELQMLLGSPTLNLTGPLQIHAGTGRPALNNLHGMITVGNHTLTLSGFETTPIGDCTLGPSGIVNSDQPLEIGSGRTLAGDGTVNSAVYCSGTITATGDGLNFGGVVEITGGTMNGVRFTFMNGGGLAGGGTVLSKIVAQPGSKISINGFAKLGDGSSTGVLLDGDLEVDSDHLNFNDTGGIDLGPTTTLRNGYILHPSGDVVIGASPTPDVVRGHGEFIVDRLVNLGIISPGIDTEDSTGTMIIAAPFVMNNGGANSGTLEFDVGSSLTDGFDRIIFGESAIIDGTFRLRLADAYTPINGVRIKVLLSQGASTNMILGEFDILDLPPRWHIEYDPKFVQAVYCAGDVNSDGFVNGDDFDNLASAFENAEPLGDFNGDGFINGDDFDEFASAFEEGC